MKNLKKIRSMKGISQKEMAERYGVSRQTYIAIENGKYISDKIILQICEDFKTTPCELLGVNNLKFLPKDKEDLEKFIEDLKKEFDKKWAC